ncbi:IS3 family transposase [Streptococcus thoraltensis]|uniref:IS3 family transposase n=1 Tax=Streptococcus thoraltensis TaxID=55085 RepID=UPI003BF4E011
MEMSISFKTGTQMTNLKHNNRELTELEYKQLAHKHIQRENSHHNIVVRQESLDEVYQKEFGQALEEYNAKQKRTDRKIKDYVHWWNHHRIHSSLN